MKKILFFTLIGICFSCSPIRYSYVCLDEQNIIINNIKVNIEIMHYDLGNTIRGVNNSLNMNMLIANTSNDTLSFHADDIKITSKKFNYAFPFILEKQGKTQEIFINPNSSLRFNIIFQNKINPKSSKELEKLLKDELLVLNSIKLETKNQKFIIAENLSWLIAK
jgi:hypothetical protein